jgi:hypothetical protein
MWIARDGLKAPLPKEWKPWYFLNLCKRESYNNELHCIAKRMMVRFITSISLPENLYGNIHVIKCTGESMNKRDKRILCHHPIGNHQWIL